MVLVEYDDYVKLVDTQIFIKKAFLFHIHNLFEACFLSQALILISQELRHPILFFFKTICLYIFPTSYPYRQYKSSSFAWSIQLISYCGVIV